MYRSGMFLAGVICAATLSANPVHSESWHGFSEGFASSASVVCGYREGPRLRIIDYRRLDAEANYLGMRHFFVTLQLFGKSHACARAYSVYGPGGVISRGLLIAQSSHFPD